MLQDFAVITVAAAVALILFRRLKQPAILGYLLVGVLIGPFTLPHSPVGNVESIRLLADVGLVVLLFALGLELGWDRIRRVGLRVVLIGVIEISLMVIIGYQVGKLLGWSANDALFLGAAVSISSSAVIVKMLNDTGDLKTIRGRLVVGILVVEDFAAVVLLSALTGIATTGASSHADVAGIIGKLVLFVVVSLIIGRLFASKITSILVRYKSTEMLLLGSLGLCFGLALLADELGMSAAAGAFLMGTVLGDTIHAPRIARITSPVRDLLAAIFFVSIGMLANFAELGKYLGPAVVVTAVVVLGKLIATTAGAFLTGHGGQTSVSVGTATTQSGEFSLAMAKVGAEHGVVGPLLYPVVTLTTVITSFTYPFLYRSAPAITRFLERVSPTWLRQYETALSGALVALRQTTALRSEGAAAVRRMLRRVLVNLGVMAFLLASGTAAVQFASAIATPLDLSESVIGLIIGGVVVTLSVPPAIMVWRALVHLTEDLTNQMTIWRTVLPDRSRRLAFARLLQHSLLAAAIIVLAVWTMPLLFELMSIGSLPPLVSIAIVAVPVIVTALAAYRVHRELSRSVRSTFLGESSIDGDEPVEKISRS